MKSTAGPVFDTTLGRDMQRLTFDPADVRALVFDVDGTLYEASIVRRVMALRLLRAVLSRPHEAVPALRAVRAYRAAQELLRDGVQPPDLASAQLELACERSGITPDAMRIHVTSWMEQAPLDVIVRAARPGLHDLLDDAAAAGLALGVCSDYPALTKLQKLGVADRFAAVVAAQDPDVARFKPSPRGLQVTARRLGVRSDEVLYVGDRAEVDGAAAARAGAHFALIGGGKGRISVRHIRVKNFEQLRQLLFGAAVT